MNIENVSVDDLRTDPDNARRHNDRNIQAIMESLRTFGQTKPIVVGDGGTVIAGNGTLMAARRLGWKTMAVVRTAMNSAQARAYGIADNRINELSDWDDGALLRSIEALAGESELLEVLGFDDAEFGELSDVEKTVDAKPRMAVYGKSPTIKVVLRIADVARFEAALASTGNRNRGAALMEIVDGWQKRQFDV